jgi:putative transcriptional regulator
MTTSASEILRRGLNGTLAYAESATRPHETVAIPVQIDVRAIRIRLGLTQSQFAVRFGFSVNTLRHWEQGRRVPEGPTRAYLLVIDREPRAVEKALRIA